MAPVYRRSAAVAMPPSERSAESPAGPVGCPASTMLPRSASLAVSVSRLEGPSTNATAGRLGLAGHRFVS